MYHMTLDKKNRVTATKSNFQNDGTIQGDKTDFTQEVKVGPLQRKVMDKMD